jgi:hypothetical protein
MSSWADEDSLCSTETAHDKRMAPRPKQVVSDRGLQRQRPQARMFVLRPSPDEDCFCASETKHDKVTAPRPEIDNWARKVDKQLVLWVKKDRQKVNNCRISPQQHCRHSGSLSIQAMLVASLVCW